MPVPQLLRYSLSPEITAFSTTRHGGYGTGTYGEWNINCYSGDDPGAIRANREALLRELGIEDSELIMPHQTHGTDGIVIEEQFFSLTHEERIAALDGRDYIATAIRGICIGVSTADCVPVLLYSSSGGVAIAMHAGWRGTLQRISSKAVREVSEYYGVSPSSFRAVIGPSISREAFEVGDEVWEAFRDAGFNMQDISERIRDRWHIDLWRTNRDELIAAGVKPENISISGICTWSRHEDFFSARREGINSGRIFSAILTKHIP